MADWTFLTNHAIQVHLPVPELGTGEPAIGEIVALLAVEQVVGVGGRQLRRDLVVPIDQGPGPSHALCHVAKHGLALIQQRA
jgi:hypothetical protein